MEQPEEFGFETEFEDPLEPSDVDAIDDLDEFPSERDIVIQQPERAPLGRSWAFDFLKPGFSTYKGRGPLEIWGIPQLRNWIEKCLRSTRGGSPIWPDGYGVEGLTEMIGQPIASLPQTLIQRRIKEALTYHPRITDVVDFDFEFDPDDEVLFCSFTVVLDDENQTLSIQQVQFPLG
jgi:hypothetical protein